MRIHGAEASRHMIAMVTRSSFISVTPTQRAALSTFAGADERKRSRAGWRVTNKYHGVI